MCWPFAGSPPSASFVAATFFPGLTNAATSAQFGRVFSARTPYCAERISSVCWTGSATTGSARRFAATVQAVACGPFAAVRKTTNFEPHTENGTVTNVRPFSSRHTSAGAHMPVSASHSSGTRPVWRKERTAEASARFGIATKYQSASALRRCSQRRRSTFFASFETTATSGATPSSLRASTGEPSKMPRAHSSSARRRTCRSPSRPHLRPGARTGFFGQTTVAPASRSFVTHTTISGETASIGGRARTR